MNAKDYWRQYIEDMIECGCCKELTEVEKEIAVERIMNDDGLWGDIDYHTQRIIEELFKYD